MHRKTIALVAFAYGTLVIAHHILVGSSGLDYVFGCLSAAVFAGYGWYHLRREIAEGPTRLT